jgi:DNA (cytosine-5)-methyltransferase 1
VKAAAVDLFCGVGGLTHGLQLAGLNVVAGIDIDASCKYPYEENNNAVFIESDVAKISSQEIAQYYGNKDIRILVGCAPCQPFSKYTKRYRKEEKEKGRKGDSWQKDKKWKLLYSFAQKIKDIEPDIVSMENVPELEKEKVFRDFLAMLKDLGYYVSYCIAYCPNYGVPQSRKRLVLLASKFGNIALIKPEFVIENYRTVRQTIGSMPKLNDGQKSLDDALHFCAKLSKLNIKRIKNSKQGGTWRDWDKSLQLKCHKKKSGKTYGAVYGRMSWDKPSPTITTQFYGYGNGRFGHPEQNRALSLREGAILQSFRPAYKFIPENLNARTRELGIHIGNAVPVELGRAIGISIRNHIKEITKDGKNNA